MYSDRKIFTATCMSSQEHRRNRQDKARKYPHDRQEKEKEMKKKKSKLSAKIKEQNKVGKSARNIPVRKRLVPRINILLPFSYLHID